MIIMTLSMVLLTESSMELDNYVKSEMCPLHFVCIWKASIGMYAIIIDFFILLSSYLKAVENDEENQHPKVSVSHM